MKNLVEIHMALSNFVAVLMTAILLIDFFQKYHCTLEIIGTDELCKKYEYHDIEQFCIRY